MARRPKSKLDDNPKASSSGRRGVERSQSQPVVNPAIAAQQRSDPIETPPTLPTSRATRRPLPDQDVQPMDADFPPPSPMRRHRSLPSTPRRTRQMRATSALEPGQAPERARGLPRRAPLASPEPDVLEFRPFRISEDSSVPLHKQLVISLTQAKEINIRKKLAFEQAMHDLKLGLKKLRPRPKSAASFVEPIQGPAMLTSSEDLESGKLPKIPSTFSEPRLGALSTPPMHHAIVISSTSPSPDSGQYRRYEDPEPSSSSYLPDFCTQRRPSDDVNDEDFCLRSDLSSCTLPDMSGFSNMSYADRVVVKWPGEDLSSSASTGEQADSLSTDMSFGDIGNSPPGFSFRDLCWQFIPIRLFGDEHYIQSKDMKFPQLAGHVPLRKTSRNTCMKALNFDCARSRRELFFYQLVDYFHRHITPHNFRQMHYKNLPLLRVTPRCDCAVSSRVFIHLQSLLPQFYGPFHHVTDKGKDFMSDDRHQYLLMDRLYSDTETCFCYSSSDNDLMKQCGYENKKDNFICLEDLTAHCQSPCVMDIKIGYDTCDPLASDAKRATEEAKYPHRRDFGFRIVGINTTYVMETKTYGKQLDTIEKVYWALSRFFDSLFESDRKRVVIGACLDQLKPILHFFNEINKGQLRFYSSSLLFVYDSAISWRRNESYDHMLKRLKRSVRVRMIDMAHVFHTHAKPEQEIKNSKGETIFESSEENLDDNYLYGLRKLFKFFSVLHHLPNARFIAQLDEASMEPFAQSYHGDDQDFKRLWEHVQVPRELRFSHYPIRKDNLDEARIKWTYEPRPYRKRFSSLVAWEREIKEINEYDDMLTQMRTNPGVIPTKKEPPGGRANSFQHLVDALSGFSRRT